MYLSQDFNAVEWVRMSVNESCLKASILWHKPSGRRRSRRICLASCVRSPQTTPGHCDSLKRLMGCRSSCFATAKGYRSWSSKAESKRKQAQASRSPSQWNYTETHLILPAMKHDNTCKVLPTREAHLSLDTQGFCCNLVTWRCSVCRSDFSYSVSGPHEVTLILHGPGPQAYKNTLTKEDVSGTQKVCPRSQSRASPETGLCLECAGFKQLRPTELALYHVPGDRERGPTSRGDCED